MAWNERRLPVAVAAMAVVGFLTACSQGHTEAGGPPGGPAVVEVQAAGTRALSLGEELPGRVEATRVAEVRARVAGIVLSKNFVEGSDVKAGQLLFKIDPAPYRTALARAKAELAKAEAAVADADAVVRRYSPLAKLEAVSQQEFDTAQATLKSAQAARQSAVADVDTAQLNLDYTSVVAPIAGRIGRGLVTEGALVGQNEATAMAVIQQLNPVYVDFTQAAAEVMKARAQGAGTAATRLSVTIEGTDQTRDGKLLFANASVDKTTGQIALRGEFANPDGLLLPGMYVRVKMANAEPTQAVVVPQRAVKRAADGKPLVMVLGQDGKVAAMPVETGRMVGPDWHITTGLQGGERVIVGGAPVNPGDAATAAGAPADTPAAEAPAAPGASAAAPAAAAAQAPAAQADAKGSAGT
ncbi:efflux RND transporter periplasmic adaptor subunit [Comamonas terrigena]|uniref:efflux RND transporter periplasmic adaptor subunit n=1 Tax=Comamonas terrigena TaxID=32013 RepID=UPI002447E8D0|nr:efflux RND transporter periplasmic adaptor subunit [Comamonas terrigena]